jgi:hypothetical protein
MKRTIVELHTESVVTNDQTASMVYAVCDDNSVWVHRTKVSFNGLIPDEKWIKLPEIPQE